MSEYDLGAVHKLLTSAFSAGELRRFCRDRDAFRPILSRLPESASLADMADTVIEYCEQHVLLEELLAGIAQVNPRQFNRFRNRIEGPVMVEEEDREPETSIPAVQQGSLWSRLLGFLSHPSWEGVGALVGIIALLVTIIGVLVAVAAWLWPDVLLPEEPRIVHDPTAAKGIVEIGEQTLITVGAKGDGLTYVWTAEYGVVEPAGQTAHSTITYTAPDYPTRDIIRVEVRDRGGEGVSGEVTINVVQDVPAP